MMQTPNTPRRNRKLLKSKGDFRREELTAFLVCLAERVRADDVHPRSRDLPPNKCGQ